jgi:hypothetical protein
MELQLTGTFQKYPLQLLCIVFLPSGKTLAIQKHIKAQKSLPGNMHGEARTLSLP